jgi:hypothetical protein
MLLEQRFTPAFAFLVGGEIDHWKVSWRRMSLVFFGSRSS